MIMINQAKLALLTFRVFTISLSSISLQTPSVIAWNAYDYIQSRFTVEPPIKDPPSKGHNRNNLSTKDTFQGPKCCLSYSGQNGWSQSVLYSEVPQYYYYCMCARAYNEHKSIYRSGYTILVSL